MGVERTQNTDNTDNDHTERGVLEYLNTRATVELSKLRAAFKYTHDQATGVVSETTMPPATPPPTYQTMADKEAEATKAGVALSDWLEMEALESGALDKVRGLHERLLHASRSGYVKSLLYVIHVGGTRDVPSSTDHIMNIQARITLTVEFIRTCLCVLLFDVSIQGRV